MSHVHVLFYKEIVSSNKAKYEIEFLGGEYVNKNKIFKSKIFFSETGLVNLQFLCPETNSFQSFH